MEKLHFSIKISAPQQKVWETMLNDATYRQWTAVFNPEGGSYYEGDWSEGSTMRFLGPDENGNIRGMFSRVKESRPYDFICIQNLGEIIGNEERIWPVAETPGQEALESYTFNKSDDGTEVVIDMVWQESDKTKGFKEMFEGLWPKALEKLKQLAEASAD
jgi:uncharacterized protein YndB with AHSA1/START domain